MDNSTTTLTAKYAQKKKDKGIDPFQSELKKGFEWTTQHTRIVTVILVAVAVIGAALGLKSYVDTKNEMTAETAYFPLEKAFLKKQSGYQAAAEPNPNKKEASPATAKASGDFTKDYGPEAAALEQFISQYPNSNAAQIAALNLSAVQNEYQQFEAAQKTLEKVNSTSSTFLAGLVASQLGNTKANRNDCAGAIEAWNKALSNPNAAFLKDTIRLKQGLCFEAMKNPEKAKSLYADVKKADKEGSLGHAAEKYSRLLGSIGTDAAKAEGKE
jgi:predicted negative regulator of RcsB-dependent stress response